MAQIRRPNAAVSTSPLPPPRLVGAGDIQMVAQMVADGASVHADAAVDDGALGDDGGQQESWQQESELYPADFSIPHVEWDVWPRDTLGLWSVPPLPEAQVQLPIPPPPPPPPPPLPPPALSQSSQTQELAFCFSKSAPAQKAPSRVAVLRKQRDDAQLELDQIRARARAARAPPGPKPPACAPPSHLVSHPATQPVPPPWRSKANKRKRE